MTDQQQQLPPALVIVFGGIQTVVLLLVTYFLYKRIASTTTKTVTTKDLLDSSKSKCHGNVLADDGTMQDVWEERRKSGVLPSANERKNFKGEKTKKFGSSYYYAHNDSQAKGGYTDGLRMEDYTMNQPRLLSRGTSSVTIEEIFPSSENQNADENNSNGEQEKEREQKQQQPIQGTTSQSPSVTTTNNIITPITRYQWDDSGEISNGVAYIRIDSLPAVGKSSSSETIAWKDMNIHQATAKLEGQGRLVVDVQAYPKILQQDQKQEQAFRLTIPQLYGKVSEVKAINKPKRLLVRLQKESKLWDKSNLKSWPHPHKKINEK